MTPEVFSSKPSGERGLWAAVLMTAIQDAMGNVRGAKGSIDSETRKARRWLTVPNRDFNEVCYLAGLDPVAVRERCQRMFREGEAVVPSGAPRGRPLHLYEYNGESLSLPEWADRVGLSVPAIRGRLQRGMTFEQAITAKLKPGTHWTKQAMSAPGVVKNFPAPEGTGGGPTTQEIPETEFSA